METDLPKVHYSDVTPGSLSGTNYSSSYYVFDFFGDEGVGLDFKLNPFKHGTYHYRQFAVSAEQEIRILIHDAGGHGQIDAVVLTETSVDKKMNEEASRLNGKRELFVAEFNDCGTGANAFLKEARKQERIAAPPTWRVAPSFMYSLYFLFE